MYEKLVAIGIIVILIGFGLIILGSLLSATKSSKTKTEWGFFGLIGPFPIIFSSSKNMFIFTAIIAAIFLIIFILLNLLYRV